MHLDGELAGSAVRWWAPVVLPDEKGAGAARLSSPSSTGAALVSVRPGLTRSGPRPHSHGWNLHPGRILIHSFDLHIFCFGRSTSEFYVLDESVNLILFIVSRHSVFVNLQSIQVHC